MSSPLSDWLSEMAGWQKSLRRCSLLLSLRLSRRDIFGASRGELATLREINWKKQQRNLMEHHYATEKYKYVSEVS